MKPITKKIKPINKRKTNKKNRNKTKRTNQKNKRLGGAASGTLDKPLPKDISAFVNIFMEYYTQSGFYPAITGGLALFLYGITLKQLYLDAGYTPEEYKDTFEYIDSLIREPTDGDLVLLFQNNPQPTPMPAGIDFEIVSRKSIKPWTVADIDSRNGTTFHGDGVSLDVIRSFSEPFTTWNKEPDNETKKKIYASKTCKLKFDGKLFTVLRLDLVKKAYENQLGLSNSDEQAKIQAKIKMLDDIKNYIEAYIKLWKDEKSFQVPEFLRQFTEDFTEYSPSSENSENSQNSQPLSFSQELFGPIHKKVKFTDSYGSKN